MSILGDLIGVLIQTLSIYTLVLFVRVLLIGLNLDWGNPVLSTVSAITDPYLSVFRGLIPPWAVWTSPRSSPSWPSNCSKVFWSRAAVTSIPRFSRPDRLQQRPAPTGADHQIHPPEYGRGH